MDKKFNPSLKQHLVTEMAKPKKTDATPAKKAEVDFVPSSGSLKQTIQLFEGMMDNMHNKQEFSQYHGPLLSGEPGTGKTQRIGLFARVLGIELITIEAPHIVEEHIVNIPFITFDPVTNKTSGGHTQMTGDEYKIELADSNLYSHIKNARKISDADLLKAIYSPNSSSDAKQLFEYFGGNETTIPESIASLRNNYTVILFLDEFFRQTSPRIRNMLRSILNNKIGSHAIPKSTFIVYATNLNDDGVDEIQKNYQFEHFEIDAPSKDEWFSWLTFKFEKDKHIKLNKKVINKFYNILEEGEISNSDFEAEVRTSPRRWEQLLLYINASLPVKSEEDAKNLMSNVKLNFKDYLSGSHAALAEKVLSATAELIEDTSGVSVTSSTINSPQEWRKTLQHQLETRDKLGNRRTYVPVIAGKPGIAKTAQAIKLAHEMDLRFIDIDVSTINAEDAVGLPLPKKGGDGKIETVFSIPSLYQQIMETIKHEDSVYIAKIKQDFPKEAAEKIEEYKNRKTKYLIFFDEMNRNSPKVFNAIRRVLLEKNFGPSAEKGKMLKLPDEAIMLAAINPHDNGAQRLTGHMKDVLDVVDAGASWKDTLSYMKNQKISGIDDQTHDLSLSIISSFAEKFKSRDTAVSIDERPFHLDVSNTEIWMSPREYDMFYKGLTRNLKGYIAKIQENDIRNMAPEDVSKLEDDLRGDIFKSFKRNLSFIFQKHEAEAHEFLADLQAWIMNTNDISFGENIFFRKVEQIKKIDFSGMLQDHMDTHDAKPLAANSDFVNVMNNIEISKLREDLTDFFISNFTTIDKMIDLVVDKKYPMKELNSDKNGVVLNNGVKVSAIENILREIMLSLQIHDYDNSKVEAITSAISSAVKAVRAKFQADPSVDQDQVWDAVSAFIEVRSNIADI